MADPQTNTTFAGRLTNQMRSQTIGSNSLCMFHMITVPEVPMMFMLRMNSTYTPGRVFMSSRSAAKLNQWWSE